MALRFLAIGISLASRFYAFENYERFVFYLWTTCPYANTLCGIIIRKLFLLATAFLDCYGSAGTENAMASSLGVVVAQQLVCFPGIAVLHQGFVFLLHTTLYFARTYQLPPPLAAIEPPRSPPLRSVENAIAWRISSVKKLINFPPPKDF